MSSKEIKEIVDLEDLRTIDWGEKSDEYLSEVNINRQFCLTNDCFNVRLYMVSHIKDYRCDEHDWKKLYSKELEDLNLASSSYKDVWADDKLFYMVSESGTRFIQSRTEIGAVVVLYSYSTVLEILEPLWKTKEECDK